MQTFPELMTRILKGAPSSHWFALSYGNVAAFSIGCGAALVAALLARARRASPAIPSTRDAWTPAALVALAVMCFGGIYFMETERIWLFAMPWLAAVGLASTTFDARSLRILLALGLVQSLAQELLLFTLW